MSSTPTHHREATSRGPRPLGLRRALPRRPKAYTSGLCQPPVHAIAALRAWEAARYEGGGEAVFGRVFLEEIYPKLLSWPKYLLTYRDLEGSGLVTIYHPWESGTDNFQRWDAALVAVEPDERRLPPYPRRDLQHVDDPSERLSAAEYDRYCGCWSR